MRQQLYGSGSDHSEVASSLTYVANSRRRLGDVVLAREMHEQALAMNQRLHEGDHPDVAWSLTFLATDLRRLGDGEGARDLDQQALVMRQRLYQGDHPDVAWSLRDPRAATFPW
jgi:hypothetical protein